MASLYIPLDLLIFLKPIIVIKDLNSALGGTKRVMFFFYTDIPVCKKMFPMLDVLSNDLYKRVDIHSINASEHSALATAMNVSVVPTIQLWHHGKLIRTFCGEQTAEMLTLGILV